MNLIQSLVALPDEARLMVLILITAGLTLVLSWVSQYIPIDVKGYAQAIAAALSPLVITAIEHYLQMIPSIYDDFVLVVIHYIVLFLGGVASIVVFRRVRQKNTRGLLS